MLKMMTNCCAALAIGCTAAVAQNGNLSGETFLEICNADVQHPEFSLCEGYMIGYSEGRAFGIFSAYAALEEGDYDRAMEFFRDVSRYCLPEEATYRQMISVAVNYIEKRPESWHTRAHLLILDSFQDAFPCTD